MDLRDVGVALWRQKLLVVLILVVTGVAAAAGVWLAPKSYTATATLSAVRPRTSHAGSTDLGDQRATLGELASSESIDQAVQDRLNGVRSLTVLRQEIHGHWVRGTSLVRVDVRDDDPRIAALIANATAAALSDQVDADDDLLVETADLAVAPTSFSSPDLPLVIGIAALMALGLAVAAAVARDRLTNTVDDAATVEEVAGAPLLGRLSPPHDLTEMPTLEPGTTAADAFRHLRIAAEATVDAHGRSVVVVAGVGSGDGPVWIAANLAIALAKAGRRVLLVDGRMGERFGRPVESEPDTPGLYDVLTGAAQLDSAMSPGPVDGLSVLPSGTWGEQEVGDLLRRRFAAAMEVAAHEFESVVVLGPPLETGHDARVMAAEGVLLLAIVKGQVSANALRSHADRVRAAGGRLLGVVLVGRRPVREPRAAKVSV